MQAFVFRLGSEVALSCPASVPTYTGIVFGSHGTAICPTHTMTVAPGDSVSLLVDEVTGKASLRDLTTRTGVVLTSYTPVGYGPAYFGMCTSPAGALPAMGLPGWCDNVGAAGPVCVPPFTPVHLTHALVNGSALGSFSPTYVPKMTDTSAVEVFAGSISSTGKAFPATFVSC